MAAVPVTIVGIETREDGTSGNVTIVGMASLTGLGVGGGPVIPKPPVGIWPGPGDPDFPGGGKPPGQPPGIWPNPPEGIAPGPSHPIALPGDPWWPPVAPKPPELPPPGSPPVILPGSTPTHPITPPPAIVVDYPGVGKILVPKPVDTAGSP